VRGPDETGESSPKADRDGPLSNLRKVRALQVLNQNSGGVPVGANPGPWKGHQVLDSTSLNVRNGLLPGPGNVRQKLRPALLEILIEGKRHHLHPDLPYLEGRHPRLAPRID